MQEEPPKKMSLRKKIGLSLCVGTVATAAVIGSVVGPPLMQLANFIDRYSIGAYNSSSIPLVLDWTYPMLLDRTEMTTGFMFHTDPEITYGSFGTPMRKNGFSVQAAYFPDIDVIGVNSDAPHILAGQPQPVFNSLLGLEHLTLEGSIVHELGHAYMQRITNYLNALGYNVPSIEDSTLNRMYVAEGIGEYARMRAVPGEESLQCNRPYTLGEVRSAQLNFAASSLIGLPFEAYTCGLELVTPIIDALGPEEGVARMLLDPPRDSELLRPESYHGRIIFGKPVAERPFNPAPQLNTLGIVEIDVR